METKQTYLGRYATDLYKMLWRVIIMIKVKVNNRTGLTTSVIPHRNGTYPIWFEDSEVVEFIESSQVEFL